MHTSFLLKDLAVIMTIAAFAMYACHRLKQPAIIGYLLAGLIIGPFTPPFSLVSDIESIRSISELGLVFLMFSLGLEFNLPRLRKAGLPAAVTAMVVVSGMILTGALAGKLLGWPTANSLMLGAVVSISGSTVIAKVFFDLKVTQEPFARAMFGLMICEDIAAMIMLSVVSGVTLHQDSLATATAFTFVRIIFFILLFLTLGLLLVPKILQAVAKFRNREMMGISALGLCFAGAFLAAHFGFSIALGTFLMGAIVAASPQKDEIENWAAPLRDMFSALFFVSAGMLVDLRAVAHNWLAVLAILALTLAGRSFWGTTASLLAGYDMRMSVRVGLSCTQIGEFSFILAAAGAASGLCGSWLYGTVVAIAMLTTFIYPHMMRNLPAIEESIVGHSGRLSSIIAAFHSRFWPHNADAAPSERPPIFSKYAMRITVYVTMLSGVLYAGGSLAELLSSAESFLGTAEQPAQYSLWVACAYAGAPLAIAIARYISHIALLAVTMTLPAMSPKLWSGLDIRLAYNAAHALCIALLALVFLLFAGNWIPSGAPLNIFATALLAAALLARNHLLTMMGLAENLLDQIIGLASSEPLHQTLVAAGGETLQLSTTRWLIEDGNALVGRSIKELNVRASTGANVISIYRAGASLANPDPDTKLLPGDIVTLFGDEKQCAAADAFFQQSQP